MEGHLKLRQKKKEKEIEIFLTTLQKVRVLFRAHLAIVKIIIIVIIIMLIITTKKVDNSA